MSLKCCVFGHARPLDRMWNDGLYFGECPRCGDPLIASAAGPWRCLPNNIQIAWRPHGAHAMEWWEAIRDAPRRRALRQKGTRAGGAFRSAH